MKSKQIAERLAAPIVKALLGKAVFPTTVPTPRAASACSGPRPRRRRWKKCDTLLMVGTSFPYIEYLPEPDQAQGVQIDIDPMRIGLRFPVEVGLVGDSQTSLEQLAAAAESRIKDRDFLERPHSQRNEEIGGIERDKRHPPRQADEAAGGGLGAWVSACATTPSSRATAEPSPPGARVRSRKRGQMFSPSGNLATMANGLPYAIAAQTGLSRPAVRRHLSATADSRC